MVDLYIILLFSTSTALFPCFNTDNQYYSGAIHSSVYPWLKSRDAICLSSNVPVQYVSVTSPHYTFGMNRITYPFTPDGAPDRMGSRYNMDVDDLQLPMNHIWPWSANIPLTDREGQPLTINHLTRREEYM